MQSPNETGPGEDPDEKAQLEKDIDDMFMSPPSDKEDDGEAEKEEDE